jgi:hypothetical protein
MPSINSVLELLRRCPPVVHRVDDEGNEFEVAVTGNTRFLLLTLVLNAAPNDATICTLSRSNLMRLTAMCKATLDTHIHALKDAGLLLRRKEKLMVDGRWRNIWRLDLTLLETTPAPASASAQETARTPASALALAVTRDSPAAATTLPSPEPADDDRVYRMCEEMVSRANAVLAITVRDTKVHAFVRIVKDYGEEVIPRMTAAVERACKRAGQSFNESQLVEGEHLYWAASDFRELLHEETRGRPSGVLGSTG